MVLWGLLHFARILHIPHLQVVGDSGYNWLGSWGEPFADDLFRRMEVENQRSYELIYRCHFSSYSQIIQCQCGRTIETILGPA